MSTVVRKYPTVVASNPGSWVNPDDMLNVEDAVCASRICTFVTGTFICNLSTFGFEIPADATIIRETIGIIGNTQHISGSTNVTSFAVKYGISTNKVSATEDLSGGCAKSRLNTVDLGVFSWISIADLNAENFIAWVEAGVVNTDWSRHYADAVYIEIEYTVPSAIKMRNLKGVGL